MARTLDDARRWAALGTDLVLRAADGLDGDAFAAPSALPGWTRAHLTAHVAANAEALSNLVHWAATGEVTPMYASPEERAAGIERGPALSAGELTVWLRESAQVLEAGTAALTEEQWRAPVVTAQGRTVPATELPWMRSREVCVHAVDLNAGVTFADLPDDFLAALCADVAAKRATAPGPAVTLRAPHDTWELPGEGEPVLVTAPLPDLAAYLTGRDAGLSAADGTPAPALGPWL
ncbi:maleylpyruvate isomerase family mycothiol-dependent enzyme [Streptomyces sp. NPDC056600]|uniref:maleylpyruvate isomerase family mycothiol-dependent enzyme n=1 Tax=Streptomyces sp. NPDC056600 TaxID=3345874 RepID=UPI00367C2C90